MKVTCPECATALDGEPGVEMVCPACMAAFSPPKLSRRTSAFDVPVAEPRAAPRPPLAPPPKKLGSLAGSEVRSWDVQLIDGATLQRLSRYAIREQVYLGLLPNTARVRRVGDDWESIGRISEFAAIFRLLGVETVPTGATRKIAAWKGEEDEKLSRGSRAPASFRDSAAGGGAGSLPAPRSGKEPAPLKAAVPKAPGVKPWMLGIVVIGAVLVLGLLWMLLG